MNKKKEIKILIVVSVLILIAAILLFMHNFFHYFTDENDELPSQTIQVSFAPHVPPAIIRKKCSIVHVDIHTSVVTLPINETNTYQYWTFGGHVPGPFIRARVGDFLEVSITNDDTSGMQHNIDFHAVSGPGGGAPLLTVRSGETKTAQFKLLHPGIFFYHCAVAPIPMHIANGMFGLLLVEPANGLPKVDKEYYVVQNEIYTDPAKANESLLHFSYHNGAMEQPTFVVFNGSVGSLMNNNALQAKTGERIRLYFGNAGPNLISSFHVIGAIFDKVYREGDLISLPARSVQTTLVPAGGATVVEFEAPVPGTYTLVDHAIFRIDKGAIGFISIRGMNRPSIYYSKEPPVTCDKCKVHP